MDRGWYAGPVGWMDATEDGEFCVALRSALLRDREARLYAGVGVVAGSDPAAELAETEVKLRGASAAAGGVGSERGSCRLRICPGMSSFCFWELPHPRGQLPPRGRRSRSWPTRDLSSGRTSSRWGLGGESPQTVINEAGWSRPSWSADGSLLTLGGYGEWRGEVVAVATADGSGLRFYKRASLEGGNPVMAPDGQTVARSVQGLRLAPQRLDGVGAASDPMAAADDGIRTEFVLSIRLEARRDGLGWLGEGQCGCRRPAHRPRRAAGAGSVGTRLFARRIGSWPSSAGENCEGERDRRWLAADRRAAGHPGRHLPPIPAPAAPVTSCLSGPAGIRPDSASRSSAPASSKTAPTDPKKGDALMAINADGTCLKRVYTDRETTLYVLTWQPGPGREAGPIPASPASASWTRLVSPRCAATLALPVGLDLDQAGACGQGPPVVPPASRAGGGGRSKRVAANLAVSIPRGVPSRASNSSLGQRLRLGQEAEDAAAVVVDDDDADRGCDVAEGREGADVVEEAEVAGDDRGRAAAGVGCADAGGDQAVDAVGAAVAEEEGRPSRWGARKASWSRIGMLEAV